MTLQPDQGEVVRVERAVIGWSNWRSGCEFYEDTEAQGEGYGRWLPRKTPGYVVEEGTPQGRLLTDALGDPEGATAVVILLPRGADPEPAIERIREALADQEGKNDG